MWIFINCDIFSFCLNSFDYNFTLKFDLKLKTMIFHGKYMTFKPFSNHILSHFLIQIENKKTDFYNILSSNLLSQEIYNLIVLKASLNPTKLNLLCFFIFRLKQDWLLREQQEQRQEILE